MHRGKSNGVCRFFSRPEGCRFGDSCRFKHISESRPSSPHASVTYMNNQCPPPDYSEFTTCDSAIKYKRDTKYYCVDDMGVFLVDDTLFKVHASQVFGPRPASVPASIEGINPTYIEDILPKISSSSDNNPIPLPHVTTKQFRDYLLAITCRPGDSGYSTFVTGYSEYWGCSRLKEVYTLYVNIATLARLFGMVKIEEWAMNMLHSMFSNPHEALIEFALLDWSADSLLHLRTLARNTGLDRPAMRFIQYFISVNLSDASPPSHNARACVDLYNTAKSSDVDVALFGCIFLKLLSLGHRSRVWSQCVTNKDRAILYAAQVQLVNASKELQSLGWLKPNAPPISGAEPKLCKNCESKTVAIWKKGFGQLGQGLGSTSPFEDISILSQVAKTHFEFHQEWKDKLKYCCGYAGRCLLLSPTELPGFLDENIRKLYEEVASRYKELTSEV
ncbi:unnamed protein product [Rhizoctonia solani]|uniref:C3H1-type domain-containing protein n=1 Tax=Rhizoctonia solani TaxID=456999 RepID=A0A8H2W9G9_9AGAM|nr:unnamed protein product [Rhizoctonia solani]